MTEALEILALVCAVAVVAASARRLGLSAPLVLVIVGVLASYVPGVPEYHLDPEVVLLGLLPPLLYAAAIRTTLVDIRTNTRAIVVAATASGGDTTAPSARAAAMPMSGITHQATRPTPAVVKATAPTARMPIARVLVRMSTSVVRIAAA